MRRIALLSVFLLALPAFLPGSAHAQATRTWISGVGDDANPCSRTAPCKTFAGAIAKTAPAGEIDCLDPGGFGALTITKSMTIDCHAGLGGGVLVSSTNGFVINAGTGDVTIRDINFQGLGGPGSTSTPGLAAINVVSAGNVMISGVNITGFGQSSNPAINVSPNCTNAVVTVDIHDTTVSNNLAGGVLLAPTGTGCLVNASLTRVNMFTNTFGLKVQDNARATVFDSVASNNAGSGFTAAATTNTAQIYLSDSVSTNNVTGVQTTGAGNAIVNLDNVTITRDTTGIDFTGGGQVIGTSPGTSLNAGNGTPGAPNATATLQ